MCSQKYFFQSQDLKSSTNSDINITPVKPQETAIETVQRCVESLVHADKCHDTDCLVGVPSCQKSKRLIQHYTNCKMRTTNRCSVCKQFVDLCCYHSRYCKEVACPAVFCENFKKKLKIQLQPKPR